MRHADQFTPEERALISAQAGKGLAIITDALVEQFDICPKCVVGLLLSALEYIIDQQAEANKATIN